MNLEIEKVNAPDEWALNICKALKADSYLNPIGGTDFFDGSKYERANINLQFQRMKIVEYDQRFGYDFLPALSIIDVLMFNDIEEINQMLDSFTL